MLRLSAVLIVLCLGGCQRPTLIGANAVLRVTEARVDFGPRWLHAKTTKRLDVANTGRAPLTIAMSTTAPFEVQPSLTLGGGESVELELHFTAAALGPLETQLVMQIEQSRHTVTLAGEGIDAPPCDSTRCRQATLDEVTARCVLSPLPDGEACIDACLTQTHCEAGACIGEPKSCDDADRCTVDACDSATGCVHAALVCPVSNPCMAARCDPLQGCVESPVTDGAACGEADCVTAQVCIQGQCVTRAVPDGATCGATSLCQLAGRCAAQVCVQPSATPLVRQWSYELNPTSRVYGLVGDDTGNLFTVECTYAGSFRAQCSMLSLGPDGAFRFRTPFPHITDTGAGGLWTHLIVAGGLVISGVEQSRLVAVDRQSGQLTWVTDTRALGVFPSPTLHSQPIALGFDGASTVIAALEGRSNSSITGSALVALELTTGALRRVFPVPAQAASLVLDRHANLYLGHGSGVPDWEDTITSFDPQGGVRWQRLGGPPADYRIRILTGVHGDQLFWSHPSQAEFTSSTDGSPVLRTTPQGRMEGVVWNDDVMFGLRQFCPNVPCRGYGEFRYEVLIVPANGTAFRRAALPHQRWFTSPWLTSADTVVLSMREATGGSILFEFDALGDTRMKCPLGLENGRGPRAEPVFSAGRYVMLSAEDGVETRIDAWSLPGYAPSARGWISQRGGPGNDLRER